MYIDKMGFVLLLTFLFLVKIKIILFMSMTCARSSELSEKDKTLLGELKTLGENLLKATLDSELRNRLMVAQLIIDSNVAQQSIIAGMHGFINQWSPVLPRVSAEDYNKFSVEFPRLLGLEELAKYKDKDGGLNHYTKGAFSSIKAKIEHDDGERLTAFKDISVLKMAQVTQETKQADESLMNSFNNFVHQKHLKVRHFNTFLRALRKY